MLVHRRDRGEQRVCADMLGEYAGHMAERGGKKGNITARIGSISRSSRTP